jgi:hypothetical protein
MRRLALILKRMNAVQLPQSFQIKTFFTIHRQTMPPSDRPERLNGAMRGLARYEDCV